MPECNSNYQWISLKEGIIKSEWHTLLLKARSYGIVTPLQSSFNEVAVDKKHTQIARLNAMLSICDLKTVD